MSDQVMWSAVVREVQRTKAAERSASTAMAKAAVEVANAVASTGHAGDYLVQAYVNARLVHAAAALAQHNALQARLRLAEDSRGHSVERLAS